MASDGSMAGAFGPEAIANPEKPVGISDIHERTLKVFPNPATNILNIEYDKAPFNVSMFNSLGVLVYSEISNDKSFSFGVEAFKKGLYIIRIKDSENGFATQKVLLK